jgi:hypothetical protein
MQYKLQRPFTSPVGAKSLVEEIRLREMNADDIVEGFSAADKFPKQVFAMAARTSSLLPEELKCLSARDYLEVQNFIVYQINGGDPANYGKPEAPPADPKAGTPSA